MSFQISELMVQLTDVSPRRGQYASGCGETTQDICMPDSTTKAVALCGSSTQDICMPDSSTKAVALCDSSTQDICVPNSTKAVAFCSETTQDICTPASTKAVAMPELGLDEFEMVRREVLVGAAAV